MIRGHAVRLFAILAVGAQLTALPAGIACAAAHARPQAQGHCDMPTAAGPAVSAGHDAGAVPQCALPGCVAQAPAAPAAAVMADASSDIPAIMPFVPRSFLYFSAAPPSPPPQA